VGAIHAWYVLIYRSKETSSCKSTIEFYRIRPGDDAHATLDWITQIVPDLDGAKVRTKSLFETLDMPRSPDGLRILDSAGAEVFTWSPGDD
jgi:hypothetical protein